MPWIEGCESGTGGTGDRRHAGGRRRFRSQGRQVDAEWLRLGLQWKMESELAAVDGELLKRVGEHQSTAVGTV